MSVTLETVRGNSDDEPIEIMAPDFDQEYYWIWLDDNPDIHMSLSREMLAELRDAIDRIIDRRET